MDATTFLTVAEQAEELLASSAVAERFDAPSALEGYTVGGLAGHLARAVLTVERYLAQPPPDPSIEATDAAGYLVRVLGAHDPVTSELHATVRERGREEAHDGPDALVARMGAARRRLAQALGPLDPAHRVAVLDGVVLRADQYLATRLVELVVHLDDLAVSIGMDAPPSLPPGAEEEVAVILVRVAVRRVGGLATVRSLARRERHPEAVRAL